MGKNKLRRFEENTTFSHVIQPQLAYPPGDHELKGKWGEEFFKNSNPIVLELGCGRGEYTVEMAMLYPWKNFIGVDWKGARLWRGAKTTHLQGLKNAAFLRIQIQHISNFFAEKEVDEIWITFPDPQPQRTRERKRLTSPRFLEMYRAMLKPRGNIHLKTDNRDFYLYTMEQVNNYDVQMAVQDIYGSENVFFNKEVIDIKTTYEKKFLAEGAKIYYLRFAF